MDHHTNEYHKRGSHYDNHEQFEILNAYPMNPRIQLELETRVHTDSKTLE